MAQLHKRFSDEQIIFLLQAYEQGLMTREEIQDTLDISRSRFFVLWKEYREDPGSFSISYQRITPMRISPESEETIEYELISIWSQIRKRTLWIFVFGGIALWFIHSPFLWKVLESTFEAKRVQFSAAPNIILC